MFIYCFEKPNPAIIIINSLISSRDKDTHFHGKKQLKNIYFIDVQDSKKDVVNSYL